MSPISLIDRLVNAYCFTHVINVTNSLILRHVPQIGHTDYIYATDTTKI
jgi:hypothetical protein